MTKTTKVKSVVARLKTENHLLSQTLQLGLAVAFGLAPLVAFGLPAQAHRMNGTFSLGSDYIGSSCNQSTQQTNSGWVQAVQGNLITHNINIGTGGTYGNGVDGVFGSSSVSGVKSWQNSHGIVMNGCVGPTTWNNMVDTNLHRFYYGNIGGVEEWIVGNHTAPYRDYYYHIDYCGSGSSDIRSGTNATPSQDYWYVDHSKSKQYEVCFAP